MTALLVTAAILTGCDRLSGDNALKDRRDAGYRAAMADYAAGRLDAAAKGLEQVVRRDPSNSSARFQLACLMQDHLHDYLGAICHYREYVILSPSSDKAGLARERADLCRRQLELDAVKRAQERGTGVAVDEYERVKKDLAAKESQVAVLSRDLATVKDALEKAEAEAARLKRLNDSFVGEEDTKKPKSEDLRGLLEDDEEDVAVTDRLKLSEEAKNLLVKDDESKVKMPYAATARRTEKPVEKKPKDPYAESRPDTYVVQEGDTLYRIATRFYGRRSAWTRIREANKTLISNDGRVRVGVTIKLPK